MKTWPGVGWRWKPTIDENMDGGVDLKVHHGWKYHGWWVGLKTHQEWEHGWLLDMKNTMYSHLIMTYIIMVSKHVPYARQCWLGPTNHVRVFLSYGSVVGRVCWLDSSLSSHKNNTNPNNYYYLLSKYLYLCVWMCFLCWMFQLL